MSQRKRICRLGIAVLSFLFSLKAVAQEPVIVTGTVYDEQSKPVELATVIAINKVDTTVRYITSTNEAGIFRFNQLMPNSTYHFRVSHVGFQQHAINDFEIKAGESNSLFIKLVSSVNAPLDEVIVVGYGTQKKVTLTGAVTQVNGDDFRDRPATNISSMLQGAIPNLNIRFGGGAPGTMGTLNVRGATSFSGNNPTNGGPLVLIDGTPGTLDRLSPEEVQSITVLKDAASAAVYGARGGFGVILVTTKSGASGKFSMRYNNIFGNATPTVRTDFMTSGYEWMKLNDAALAHVGGYSGYTEQDYAELYARRNDVTEDPSRPWVTVQNRNGKDQYVYYGNYDWWDAMFTKWQPYQNHNLNITGGSDKVTFMINGNAKFMDGIMRLNTDKYNTYGLRTKVAAKLNDWIKISQNTNFYHMKYDYYGRNGGANANFVHINVHASPAYAPWNPDGTATYRTGLNNYDIADGLYSILINGKSRGVDRKYELTSISEAVITPFKGMTITGNFSYNLYTDPSFYREAPSTYSLYPGVEEPVPRFITDRLSESQQFNQVLVTNVFAEYNKSFARTHNFKVMAGYNQEHHRSKRIGAARFNLTSQELNDLDLATGDMTTSGGSSAFALKGAFYRVNYDYKGKYLLETSGRYDGSSRFPKNDRWGFFPSASAGWRVSEEGFWTGLKQAVSDFKIRASVGQLGNQAVSSPYPYVSTLNPFVPGSNGYVNYILDGERMVYYKAPQPVSASLTWERITTYNGGIDLGFLRNRLLVTYDQYVRYTSGILAAGIKIPNVYGATQPLENVADIRTQGFELSLAWKDQFAVGGKPLMYTLGAMLSDNYATVTKVNNPTRQTFTMYEGKRMGEIWGYVTDGYFRTDAEARTYPVDQRWLNGVRNDNNIPLRAGDLRWVDLNGDGIINAGANTVDDPGDQRRLGNSTPRYSYAFNGGINWNGFDVAAFFQGIGKLDWYPGNNADRFWGPYSRPYFSFIPKDFANDVYSAENPNAYFPNLLAYVALNANNELRATNNKYLQDLAYLRLRNLTIGYRIPETFTKRYKIQSFRVFASGENLVTWTKLRTKYIDPEQAMANIDGRVYPFTKIYSFGIDITF
ncbi:TonB-dependent receptor [Niabella yanshanensis]|uniref:TonB-dependent receptor n=1 Tax=Niabella yanshanensis TaxID=577386 RepID=A0ABZ0W6I9_9BACT|nr:TonB-dependent receptor [Niabella yanshanensis]WQD37740.1 TonB-dependent receptor [Niabella yanshanensis]